MGGSTLQELSCSVVGAGQQAPGHTFCQRPQFLPGHTSSFARAFLLGGSGGGAVLNRLLKNAVRGALPVCDRALPGRAVMALLAPIAQAPAAPPTISIGWYALAGWAESAGANISASLYRWRRSGGCPPHGGARLPPPQEGFPSHLTEPCVRSLWIP